MVISKLKRQRQKPTTKQRSKLGVSSPLSLTSEQAREKSDARGHANLVKQILIACGSRQDCRLWSNQTGVARALDHDGIIRFGLVGSSDILGIGNRGVFLAIEVKTGKAKQSKEQVAFMNMVAKFGGYYLVARSVEDVTIFLNALQSTNVPIRELIE